MVTGEESNRQTSIKPLRVLTYNIWFARHERECRTAAQLLIIQEEDPDVICLQEVTPETRQSFLEALGDNYDASPFDIKGGYGIMTFSKKKLHATFRLHKCNAGDFERNQFDREYFEFIKSKKVQYCVGDNEKPFLKQKPNDKDKVFLKGTRDSLVLE